jgi:glycosyltransferase involved in cell wall biosynthesis
MHVAFLSMILNVPDSSPISQHRRIVFIANTMYSRILSGGDVHTLMMAEGAVRRDHPVHIFAGHGLKLQIEERRLPVGLTLTDDGLLPVDQWDSLKGQASLFYDYTRRLRGSFRQLNQISEEDVAYLNTDLWWDVLPGIRSRARRKLMILGMDSPTLGQVLAASRPDVKPIRIPSLHYWFSQQLGLRLFRRCPRKRLFYVHPDQKPRLLRMGYREDELVFISNGVDVARADAIPEQTKEYDVVWTGRVHAQKGIDDLLATLSHLAREIPDFKAMLIGKVKERLEPRVRALKLNRHVQFSGYVSEDEKFRLLKCSRLFLMPSRYESWGIVIGEALACGAPVLGYRLDCYPAVFGDLVCYVPCFDSPAYRTEAARLVKALRAGENCLEPARLAKFKEENSWAAAQDKFCQAVAALG